MATKVKGDAIKEGSIPLSALSSELQDKVNNSGGADWNAKEGEPGYIKNKPFRFIDGTGKEYVFTNPLKIENFTPVSTEYGVYKYKKPTDAGSIKFVVSNKSTSEYGDIYETPYTPLPKRDNKYRVDLSDYSGYVYIERGDEHNWLIVEMDYEDCFFPENTIYVIDEYDDDLWVEKIPELCLPNTVLKTTPQTLSNTDKNQIKENLGISTPDWNAKEGEAGYIENKPITKKFIKEQSMEFSDVDEWNSIYKGYDAVPSNTTVAKVFADITPYGGEHITTTVIVKKGESVGILENDEENYLEISMYDTSEGLTMNVGASFAFGGTLKCYYYEEFKQLDEDYIPDTIARKDYVKTQIAGAITNTINANY